MANSAHLSPWPRCGCRSFLVNESLGDRCGRGHCGHDIDDHDDDTGRCLRLVSVNAAGRPAGSSDAQTPERAVTGPSDATRAARSTSPAVATGRPEANDEAADGATVGEVAYVSQLDDALSDPGLIADWLFGRAVECTPGRVDLSQQMVAAIIGHLRRLNRPRNITIGGA